MSILITIGRTDTDNILAGTAGLGSPLQTDDSRLDYLDAPVSEAGSIDAQAVRDAMKLAPSAGASASGSIDDKLNDLATQADDNTDLVIAAVNTLNAGSTGARSLSFTVKCGTDLLQNAKIRLTEGTSAFTLTTDASGVATTSVDDATFTVAITKFGYSFTPTTLVVDGDKTVAYQMTAESIPLPTSPNLSAGYCYVFDENGAADVGVLFTTQMITVPYGTGVSYDADYVTDISNSSGLLLISNLWRGATYRTRREKGEWKTFIVPDASSFELPATIGYVRM